MREVLRPIFALPAGRPERASELGVPVDRRSRGIARIWRSCLHSFCIVWHKFYVYILSYDLIVHTCFHVFVFALRGDENWWKTLKHTEALFGARWARIPPMWVQDYKQLWYNCYIWYCMWAVYHIYTIIYTLNIFKCIILNYNISNTLPSPGLIHVYSGDHKMRQMQWLRLQAALLYEARAGRCFGYCSGQRSSSSWNVSSDVPGF